ncbi:nuclear transport factor 2 family protein [Rhodocytophaga rosea]|uniref:Nuclear transport factor 2 family protein n=1 Tax=Rhodocytophaga rosea TaxID=2704465 RepID=A0A6C0GI23_9BACT|nr:nuclear transport factor 2 family protein [Rhodocytophaga rosea]QHT67370.1 nuclear transport factor 2 family protein [Rhodocytophaga rosea]
MRYFNILIVFLILVGCHQPSEQVSSKEIEQIKSDIIKRSEKHAADLENMDYQSVMAFYAKDLIVFGDGYYWGDYLTMDGIWKNILGEGGWKKMVKWDLQNHKIHVHSANAASYLVEFDHAHLVENGDTVRSSGCFTYGMQKVDGEWKAVTAHVSHIAFRTDDEKWWSKYSPSKTTNIAE